MAAAPQDSPLLKQLASSNKKTRDEAFQNLSSYLQKRKSFNELELLKLWKGLFFCMWMSDKPRVQQRLAVEMASLVDTLPQETVLLFLNAFWKTMAREWAGIDALRLNKFLVLVRQYLAASFRYFERRNWAETSDLEDYLDVLSETPLNPTDKKLPNGLRYHLIDIYVDEIDRLNTSEDSGIPIERLLGPVRKLLAESHTKAVRDRAREALEDDRVKEWTSPGAEQNDEAMAVADEDEWGGLDG